MCRASSRVSSLAAVRRAVRMGRRPLLFALDAPDQGFVCLNSFLSAIEMQRQRSPAYNHTLLASDFTSARTHSRTTRRDCAEC